MYEHSRLSGAVAQELGSLEIRYNLTIDKMEDTLVSFDTAKLAKDLGFNIPCRAKIHCSHYCFILNNIIPTNIRTDAKEMFAPIKDWNAKQVMHKGNLDLYTSLPTQSLLQKWLREIHTIHINLIPLTRKRLYSYSIVDLESLEYIMNSKTYNFNYEDTLEIALKEGLKLIKTK